MIALLTLAGCMGALRTEDGADRIRGALWFADDADGPTETLVLLSNSALPCAAEDTPDDPETGLDEQAAALQYWQAQAASAFTREGAIVVMLGLYTWNTAQQGDYALSADGLEQHLSLLEASPRVGFGTWLRVLESEVTESNGVFSNYTVTDLDFEAAAAAPSHATLDERAGERLSGDFDLGSSGISGDFHAEHCDNPALYTAVFNEVVALHYAK